MASRSSQSCPGEHSWISAQPSHISRFGDTSIFPSLFWSAGTSGTLGPYQFTAPSLTLGTNPDTVSDTRIGFDVRLFGEPGGLLRLGAGAQGYIPSGNRADYVTDARYRGMFRFLAAGDAGAFRYAGQLGIHVRSLNEAPVPGQSKRERVPLRCQRGTQLYVIQ